MARPTAYKGEYATQAQKLCDLGATDDEIAGFFEVSVRTIHRWKAAHEEFCHSLKVGKESADDRVERSLYHRAVGYQVQDTKVFNNNGSPMLVPYVKTVASDTTAAIYWLNNRRKDKWRNRHEIDNTSSDGSMSPAKGLDASMLSTEALEEILLASSDTESN